MTNGPPFGGNGLLTVGINQIAVPIPGTACSIYTTPLIYFPIQYSLGGTWSHSFVLPTARPFTATVQAASLRTTVFTSNALIVSVLR